MILTRKVLTIALLSFLISIQSYSQSEESLKEINKMWEKYYQAYDSLDYRIMAEIHSDDLVRVAGGEKIHNYESYISSCKSRFESSKVRGMTNHLTLRFFERTNNDSIASERGIYRYVRADEFRDEKAHYGQFHVILKKENDQWKIRMDYDSNESETIGETDYKEAHPMEEIHHFIKD